MNTLKTDIRMSGDYQRKVSDLVNREVLTGVNELMQTLLKSEDIREGEYSEELISICGTENYMEPAQDTVENGDELQEYLDWFNNAHHEIYTKESLLKAFSETDEISGLFDFCDQFDIEPYQIETYEFWVVSEWFGRQLTEHNENVQEILGLTIWGRTCSGQSISMDGVICDIYDSVQS